MFSGLDEIDWAQLIHAYGAASDVPDDIRALVSSDEKSAKDALWSLYGTIYHQGTRYTATAPAVPYLAEAAVALDPKRAASVLGLLSAIAEPAADRIYENQLTVEAFGSTIRAEEDALTAEQMAQCQEFGFPPTVETEVYEAVAAQIPRLMSELDVSQRDIQMSLLELLSNFPRHSEDAKDLAERAVFSSADDVELQVAAVESLSRLGRSVELEDFGPFFDKLGARHSSPFLKAHVVLARSDSSKDRLDGLLSALQHADELYEIDRLSERGGGWTVSHLANALKPWAATEKHPICEALMRSLPAAQRINADTSVLVDVLVYTVAYPQPPKGYFSEKKAKDRTSLEERVLRQIVEFGSWKVGDQWFGNFTMQMRSYGLPDRPADLQRYLETK